MRLSRTVPRKTKILDTVRKTSFCFGIIVFIICVGLYAEYRGFDIGLLIAEKESADLPVVDGIKFSDHGIRINEYFAGKYQHIAWLLAMYLILAFIEGRLNDKFFKSRIILQGFIFTSLVLILYQLWWIFSEKALATSSIAWSQPNNVLLRELIPFDWATLIIVFVLLLTQSIVSIKTNRRRSIQRG